VCSYVSTLALRVAARYALEQGVKHGPFTIHAEGVDAADLGHVLKALDEATHKLQGSKFSHVLYGNVYVVPNLIGEHHWMASYTSGRDTLQLSTKMGSNAVHALVHEFGHRYEARFLLRSRFEDWKRLLAGAPIVRTFTHRDRELYADYYVHELREMRGDQVPSKAEPPGYDDFRNVDRPGEVGPLLDRFDANDDTAIPALRDYFGMLHKQAPIEVEIGRDATVQISLYAGRDAHEQFAEGFAYYVLGKSMAKLAQRFFDAL